LTCWIVLEFFVATTLRFVELLDCFIFTILFSL
jgi:hypothetical protein